jgi:hypothetical protein
MTTAWRGANFRKQHIYEEPVAVIPPVVVCRNCGSDKLVKGAEPGDVDCRVCWSTTYIFEPLRAPSDMVRIKHPQTLKTAQRGCDVEDCEQPHKAKGYCPHHYDRLLRGLPVAAAKRTPRSMGVAI